MKTKTAPPRPGQCLYNADCPCSHHVSTVTNATSIFPLLYKQGKDGSLMYWQISSRCFQINTEYGQVGTTSPQFTTENIEAGKNIGRANETTPTEQAHAEARSRWEKKVKSGYTKDREKAERGDDEIGVPKPMLAHKFEEQGHKIKFPCHGSPKLDGMRLMAIIRNGECTLYSRGRLEVTCLPHIQEEILEAFGDFEVDGMLMLDGEAYNHKLFQTDFEKLMSICRKKKPDPNHMDIQFHIFDALWTGGETAGFGERLSFLKRYLDGTEWEYLRRVRVFKVNDTDHALELLEFYQSKGYEGLMFRNKGCAYEQSRTANLQKYKGWIDEEFEIADIDHGTGRMEDGAIFICYTPGREDTFRAVMAATMEERKKYLANKDKYIGSLLMVKFQNYLKSGKPRFPTGVRILK